jgi:hypothetical protein
MTGNQKYILGDGSLFVMGMTVYTGFWKRPRRIDTSDETHRIRTLTFSVAGKPGRETYKYFLNSKADDKKFKDVMMGKFGPSLDNCFSSYEALVSHEIKEIAERALLETESLVDVLRKKPSATSGFVLTNSAETALEYLQKVDKLLSPVQFPNKVKEA